MGRIVMMQNYVDPVERDGKLTGGKITYTRGFYYRVDEALAKKLIDEGFAYDEDVGPPKPPVVEEEEEEEEEEEGVEFTIETMDADVVDEEGGE